MYITLVIVHIIFNPFISRITAVTRIYQDWGYSSFCQYWSLYLFPIWYIQVWIISREISLHFYWKENLIGPDDNGVSSFLVRFDHDDKGFYLVLLMRVILKRWILLRWYLFLFMIISVCKRELFLPVLYNTCRSEPFFLLMRLSNGVYEDK